VHNSGYQVSVTLAQRNLVEEALVAGKYVMCILVPMMRRLCTHHDIVN
jgi:hypothetical protein